MSDKRKSVSLTESRDQSDPGDEVLRKFRYQHAYGVILGVSMATNKRDYKAIWCEQHEDFLGETKDGFFDAYQVKTQPESEKWEINDEAFKKSIKRFVLLSIKYPNKIRKFFFVSNSGYSDSNSEKREFLSPVKLLKAVRSVPQWKNLDGKPKEGFECLQEATETEAEHLFLVLQRLDLVVGPTQRAYEDELCQRHISTLPLCRLSSADTLAKVGESLISLFARAASLYTRDPERDLIGVNDESDPYLLAKRIISEHIVLAVRDVLHSSVQFHPGLLSINPQPNNAKKKILLKKLLQGGLLPQYEIMRRRTINAEHKLLELSTRTEFAENQLSQIENVVFGECADAHLRASTRGQETYGSMMMIDVQERLKHLAEFDPPKVCYEPYEVLVGVAGLLTEECKVWWSKPFDVEEQE